MPGKLEWKLQDLILPTTTSNFIGIDILGHHVVPCESPCNLRERMPSTAPKKHIPDSESATSTAENHIRIYRGRRLGLAHKRRVRALWITSGRIAHEDRLFMLLIDCGEMGEGEPESRKRSSLKALGTLIAPTRHGASILLPSSQELKLML